MPTKEERKIERTPMERKRNRTPVGQRSATVEGSSPTKSPATKKKFEGNVAMDDDTKGTIPTQNQVREQRLREREERRKRAETQKATAKNGKQKNNNNSKGDDDDATFVAKDPDDDEHTISAPPSKTSRGRKQKNNPFEEEDEASVKTKPSKPRGRSKSLEQGGTKASGKRESKSRDKKPKSRSQSMGTSTSHDSKKSRANSVPAKDKKKAKGRGKRGQSVDTATSDKSNAYVQPSSSDSSSSTPKKKRSPSPSSTKSTKTAKFSTDIPNNEGKTASTKKHAKAKKKETYAKKAAQEVKKNWIYNTIMAFDTKLGKCNSPPNEMYGRMSMVLAVFQEIDPECAIGDHMNEKAEPIRSPAEYNNWKSHGTYQRHYTLDWEPAWQWDKINNDKGRAFRGAFILLSDKPPEEILQICRVDLRMKFKGSVGIKEMQELHTNVDLILLGVHANTFSESVASDFKAGLIKAEEGAFRRMEMYEQAGAGEYDDVYDLLDRNWKNLDFPEILGVRSYPKQGPYEESKAGSDTSWKLAHHFQSANRCSDRIAVALTEFKRSGALNRLFGQQAIIVNISEVTKSGKDQYNSLILKHQNTNRSVGSVTLPGAISIDEEMTIFFEETSPPQITYKTMTVRDIIRKCYVKIGARRIPAFLYASKTSGGHHQLYFWDTVPEIQDFVNTFSRQGAAFLWHRCMLWGWEKKATKDLFMKSFDSTTAISAMNSKWSEKKGCAVEIEMSPEAAAFLNFGSSPFILKDGEDKISRKNARKGTIRRGNLKPEDIGGIDTDDLDSVGDESHAETVFARKSAVEDDEDSEDDYDDDVSRMSEGEDFDTDEEHTVAQDNDNDSEEDSYEAEEYIVNSDDDSAFATKAGKKDLDDLKAGGRKIREDTAREYEEKIARMELERVQAESRMMEERLASERELKGRMKEMEDYFNLKMESVFDRLKVAENKDTKDEAETVKDGEDDSSRPGAAVEDPKEADKPLKETSSSVPARDA